MSAAVPARAQADAAQPAKDMAFPLDAARRARNFAQAAGEYGPADQGLGRVAQAVRDMLATTSDPGGPYLARYRLSSADLGDVLALAYYTAVTLGDGGRIDPPSQEQVDGLRRQIAGASGLAFAGFSPADKQDFTDRLLFTMLVQRAVAEGLAGSPQLHGFVAEFNRANSQLLGFDVARARIGPDGRIGPADRSGAAAPPVPPATPPAPAIAGPASGIGATAALANAAGSPILGVGVDHQLRNTFGLNGLSLEGVTTVFVLFGDGSACIDCLDPLVEGRLPAFAADNPELFGRWTKAGATYAITRADGERDEVAAGALAPPSPAGTTVAGHLRGIEGAHGVQSIRELELRADGSFVWDSSTSAIGRNYTAQVDSAARPGSYRIDGYRMTLRDADGSERVLSFFPKMDEPGVYIIGGTPFVPD